MSHPWIWLKITGVAIASTITCKCNFAIAQITPDATLPNNSRVTTQANLIIIEGGTQARNNLFHSFEQFSVPNGATAYFNNTTDVQNIISRVTGKSASNIDGIIRTNGTANLFLINPNGILFGPNASLNINGSFLASTASSLNFANGTKFSATDPQPAALLTVSVPIGLQFGATVAPIRNQSQAHQPIGLAVQSDKTLALVGGDVTLEGGNLTASGGRIELGSVGGGSFVSLNPSNQGWVLGYESVRNFQNIQLIQRIVDGSQIGSTVNASGEGGGNIQIRGNHVKLTENTKIVALTLGSQSGGDLRVNASESLELVGPGTRLQTATEFNSTGKSGNLTIATKKLIVRNGAQVSTLTVGEGAGGNLTVKASESVDIIGSYPLPNTDIVEYSALSSETAGAGKAGNIAIDTKRLLIQDGGLVTAASSGGVDPQPKPTPALFTPATGDGGSLTVTVSESVELIGTTATGRPSRLAAFTESSGNAGNLTISTEQLIVRDGAAVTVSSEVPNNVNYLGDRNNLGKAGNLSIYARSIRLDNKGKLSSETGIGQGGNIFIQVQDLLLLRRNSQISTNAGKEQVLGDGGNIFINAIDGFIVAQAKENSDITANAFTGSGGKVQINTTGLFGIVPRSRNELASLLKVNNSSELNPQRLETSDITAISQTNPNLSGVININTPDLDPNAGFINLPVEVNEPKFASGCASATQNESEFIITGGGGLPANPREFLRSYPVSVPWVTLDIDTQKRATNIENGDREQEISAVFGRQNGKDINSVQNRVVEASEWIRDQDGNVILVAHDPNKTSHSFMFCLENRAQGVDL